MQVFSNIFNLFKLPAIEESKEVVLFNIMHGGYKVNDSSKINTFKTPSTIYTLYKAPENACAFSNNSQNHETLTMIIKFYKLNNSIHDFLNSIIEIFKIFNTHNPYDMIDNSSKYMYSRTHFETTHQKDAYRVEYSKKGKEIRNKYYSLNENDLNLGIIFVNDVILDTKYIPKFSIKLHKTYSYQIGELINNQFIYYKTGTNLLSCPYFINYVVDNFNPTDYTIGYYQLKSYPNNNKQPIECINELSNDILLFYFRNIKRIIHIDTSCQSYIIPGLPDRYNDINTPPITPEHSKLGETINKLINKTKSKPNMSALNSSSPINTLFELNDMISENKYFSSSSIKKKTKKQKQGTLLKKKKSKKRR